MTDYAHLVTDDLRVLDGTRNGGTPYDVLYLDIDEDEVSLASQTLHGGDGTPMRVWNGRTRRFELARGRVVLSLDALRHDLAADGRLAVLIERIQGGLSETWDGNNWVGLLTADARAAEEQLGCALYGRSLDYVDDGAMLEDEDMFVADDASQAITALTSDDEIDAYLAESRAEASRAGVLLLGDARDYLIGLRDDKRRELED